MKNLIESDPSFEQNYKNKKFSIQNAQINGQSAETYMAEAVASISGDGFELGEEETSYKYPEKNSRIINTCASFDNIGSAFIKRNEHKFIINTKNCVGFNSQYNYYYSIILLILLSIYLNLHRYLSQIDFQDNYHQIMEIHMNHSYTLCYLQMSYKFYHYERFSHKY